MQVKFAFISEQRVNRDDCKSPSLTLNVLTYQLILEIIKTNVLTVLSNFDPIKYLELIFVLTNFEITILLKLTSQIFIGFL